MELLWPGLLFGLGLVPLLVLAYWWLLRRRRRFAVRYSSLALVRAALPQNNRWRRHLPALIFLGALSSLAFALTRPVVTANVPLNQAVIILALDVSRSMCATDIPPNRLAAAEEAALGFVQRQPPGTRIGIVAFAGFAELVQAPTTDKAALQTAILGLSAARRTAVGSAILRSIDAIAEVDPRVAPVITGLSQIATVTPVAPGEYVPDVIVLLTDGATNSGPLPADAALAAAARGVRVYTIGFGTANPGAGLPNCGASSGSEDFFGGGGGFGFGGGGGGGFRRGIDEATLQLVADETGGEYYAATSASELNRVFEDLPTSSITRREKVEISAMFAALGALLAVGAIALSLRWQPLL
jgi:Ca-activated chloride channel family protein